MVQAKPAHDPLTYERALPLDLLPYQERTDKYYSVGTAFAIGHGRYVTAGHVLLAGLDSLWGPPELRDNQGNVYPIDKIEKFGLRRDFAVFTLAGKPMGAALKIDSKPALDQVVYAVGNALGTGVVIRDGLYTSNTPERQDGTWKWMRFSAATSPGNSGGPLLDKDGGVIGVVLAKSPSENLNYALPIREVLDAPNDQAVLDERTAYSLDVLAGALQTDILKAKFALPLDLSDFYRTYGDLVNKHEDAQQDALLKREASNLFPNGPGSSRLLNNDPDRMFFPALVERDSSGKWDDVLANNTRLTLDANGYIDAGELGHQWLFHIRRPDNLDPAAFYGNAKTRMDLLTKTGKLHRPVGSERIKIISLGKPIQELQLIDRWQRPWRIDVWPLPFLNAKLVACFLPVPDGSMVMVRTTPSAGLHDAILDFDQRVNFVYVSYTGTLAQWKAFLAEPSLLPGAFHDIRINFDYGQRFSYTSHRMAFSYTPALQAITPDSRLELAFSYFPDGSQVVWDVGDVMVWKTSTDSNHDHINVLRWHAPPAGSDEDLTSRWLKVLKREHPYDGVARSENDVMKIDGVVVPQKADAKPKVLYSVFYGVDGEHPQDFMKDKLKLLMKHLQVSEH